jgi:hypothetical protein
MKFRFAESLSRFCLFPSQMSVIRPVHNVGKLNDEFFFFSFFCFAQPFFFSFLFAFWKNPKQNKMVERNVLLIPPSKIFLLKIKIVVRVPLGLLNWIQSVALRTNRKIFLFYLRFEILPPFYKGQIKA